MIAGLWILSIVGSWCNFLTLFYICKFRSSLDVSFIFSFFVTASHFVDPPSNLAAFVLLHTVPVLYEKYEDKVDPLAEKAMHEIKKQYAVFDEKVLSKIPRGPLKDKKKD